MGAIQLFEFQDRRVRCVQDERGEPWFVAKDVCEVLEIKNARDAVVRITGDDVGSTDTIDSLGRRQSLNTVNESGLYDLIFQSRKPQARVFRRWVTSEVLPTIRKTGGYGEMATALARLVDAVDRFEERLNRLETADRPALVAPAAARQPRDMTTPEVCRYLRISETKLLELRSAGVFPGAWRAGVAYRYPTDEVMAYDERRRLPQRAACARRSSSCHAPGCFYSAGAL